MFDLNKNSSSVPEIFRILASLTDLFPIKLNEQGYYISCVDRAMERFIKKVIAHEDVINIETVSIKLLLPDLKRKVHKLVEYIRHSYPLDFLNDNLSPFYLYTNKAYNFLVGLLSILELGRACFLIDPAKDCKKLRLLFERHDLKFIILETDVIQEMPFATIKGFTFINKQVYRTIPRSQIVDLDNKLPIPNRSIINLENYSKKIGISPVKYNISIMTARGCPYECAYCHKIWPRSYVARSFENIFQEIKLYYEVGIRRFTIIDDIFNIDVKNSSKFFEKVIDNKLAIQIFFSNGLRGDLLTKDYIDLMIEAGTIHIALALETASPRLQKLINKNLCIGKLRDNLEYISSQYPEVLLELFTMHGFPTETEDEANLTLQFIKDIKWLDFAYINILKIFPNTNMADLAMRHGIGFKEILESEHLAYHQLPKTLPFDKSFTLRYQADFFSTYLLSKERLLHVLPYQMRIFTEDELVEKLNSFLPVKIDSFNSFLQFVNIPREMFKDYTFRDRETVEVFDLNKKVAAFSPSNKSNKNAMKILLIDVSQFFSGMFDIMYDVMEAPLGLMYLATYLHRQLGSEVECKIIKSRCDFNSFADLKDILVKFTPDVIGIRTLTFFKSFFHLTIAKIRQWGITVPIITGGPYATSDYKIMLNDSNIDVAVLGEGELTFCELIENIKVNNRQLPDFESLKQIKGIAFIPKSVPKKNNQIREVIFLDDICYECPSCPSKKINGLVAT